MTVARVLAAILFALAVTFAAPVGHADEGGSRRTASAGIRAGASLNPDQVVVGLEASLSRMLGPLDFAPSLDFGFGDDMTTVLVNGDLVLPFSLPSSNSRLYAGGGLNLAVYDPRTGDNDSKLGVTAVAGVLLPMGSSNAYNLQFRIGIGDMPDLRVLLGLSFGGGRR